ncbi:MAG: hypothetical protein ONB17_11685, partial [candidate division KSB1 bacterium]|nr:hypothetical protein [candidate division KSB1 bacterium]
PRMTAPETGRFFRLLEPGLYQLAVMAQGYRSCHQTVRVVQGPAVELVVELARLDEAAVGS